MLLKSERLKLKLLGLISLPNPTNDTRILSHAVRRAVDSIFNDGIRFYKSGVGAIGIVPDTAVQNDLFCGSNGNDDLMDCLDNINNRFGGNTLQVASKGFHQRSAMKRNYLSPQYTTNWADIPVVHCK